MYPVVSIVVRKGSDGAMTLVRQPVTPLTTDQARIIEEQK